MSEFGCTVGGLGFRRVFSRTSYRFLRDLLGFHGVP